MSLPPDIEAHLRRLYGDDAASLGARLKRLAAEVDGVGPRVLRCVLHLAGGDLDLVDQYSESVRQDWRDVIYWAEYDQDESRLRDLNQPFDEPAGDA